MEIKRDEIFHLIRWINVVMGIACFYLFMLGAGHYMLAIGSLNWAMWAFTRKKNV